MLSPITCTTPDEPGLMYSTRRGLEELACACSTTEPATAASRTTLLVMLSWAVRLYMPGARTMWPTAELASALVRSALVLTWVCGDGGVGGGDGNGGGGDGDGGGGDGDGGGGDGVDGGGGDGGGGGEVDGGDKLDRGLGGAEAEESEDATKSRTELTYVKCASRLAGEPAGAAQSL